MRDWAERAELQAGVIARRQLFELGMADTLVDSLVSCGAVRQVHRGVYLAKGAPLTYEARLWSAVLATEGVLGFGTATHLWGMAERPALINVIIRRDFHRWNEPGIRTHRIDLNPWAIGIRNGLPVTTRRETALDHIGRLRAGAYMSFADRAIQQGWLTARDFEDRVRRQPGRIGNTRLRILSTIVGDGAAAQSERKLHSLLRGAGLTGWTPNRDIWLNGELIAVIDIAFDAAMLAVEIDGMAHHVSADQFQRDRTRQNTLIGLGWTVLRFTWSDLVERPGYVIATIRRHLTNSGWLTA